MAGSLFSNAVISFFVNTKQAESALGALERTFSGTTSKMLGSLAGFAGIKGLKGTYDLLQDIVHLSERWNLPVEDVSRFINLFSQFGGKAEDAAQAVEQLQHLEKELALHSDGALIKLSAMIGQNLNNKDYEGAIKALRNAYKGLNVNAQNDVLDIIGTKNQAFLRMLRASDDEYAKMIREARSMRTITKDMADDLTEVEKKLAVIRQRWVGIGAVALETFKPVVDVLDTITKKIENLPDKVIHGLTLIGTAITAMSAKWAVTAVGRLLGIGGAAKAATTAATTAAGATTAGAGTAAGLASTGVVGAGLATVAGLGYLVNENLKLEEKAKNRTADEKAALNNILANLMGKESLQEPAMMTRIPIAQSLNKNDWVGKSSPVTTNDNRSVTINIYGVDGAEDMMSKLRGLPANNMSPISWK